MGASGFFSEGTLSLGASAFFSDGTLSLETFVSSLEGDPFRESVFFFFSASEKERVPLVQNKENIYSVYENKNPFNITMQLHLLSKRKRVQLRWFALTFVQIKLVWRIGQTKQLYKKIKLLAQGFREYIHEFPLQLL